MLLVKKNDMKFSIITVCYNDKEGLQKTIKSVVKQSSVNYEYIIIDGGSTDGSVDVIKKFSSKINYWISEPDKGVYSAMNKGINVAKGEYTIFMNAGDTFYSNNILEKVDNLNLHCDLAVGNASMTRAGKECSVVSPPQEITLGFWIYHSVIHQAAFMRTSMLKEKMYDETFEIVSDWKYMLEEYITREYNYQPIPFIICCFDTTGISSDKIKRMNERDRVLKELFPPMLYAEYGKYKGFKPMFLDTQFIESLNEIFKYKTLYKFYSFITPRILKIYRMVRIK